MERSVIISSICDGIARAKEQMIVKVLHQENNFCYTASFMFVYFFSGIMKNATKQKSKSKKCEIYHLEAFFSMCVCVCLSGCTFCRVISSLKSDHKIRNLSINVTVCFISCMERTFMYV